MVGISGTSKTGSLYFYYNCKKHRENKVACRKKQIPRDWAEEQVCLQLRHIISRPEVISALADAAIRYLKETQDTEEIRVLSDRLARVTIEKNNTLKAIRAGIFAASVQQMLQELEAEESALRGKISLAQDRIKDDITREDVIAFVESFQNGDIHDKAYQEQLFNAFLVRVYFYDDKLVVVFDYTGKGTEEIEVPFNIDDIEDKAVESFNLSETEDCSYRLSQGRPELPYTNTIKIYLICGLFVLVKQIAGKR